MPQTSASTEVKTLYRKFVGKKILFILAFLVFLIIIIGVSASIGSAELTVWDVYSAILNKFFPGYFQTEWLAETVVWNLRLPRISLGIVAGASLGIAGVVMQGILRNPLASPYTTGISAGAGFGASLAIIAGAGFIGGQYLVVGNAFIFSLLCSFIIIAFASKRGATPETMILIGIAILYILSAMTTLLQYFGEETAVVEALFWMVGGLDRASWNKVMISTIVFVPSLIFLQIKTWDLNIMVAGDETAKSIGVNVKRLRIVTLSVTSLMVASTVAFTGTIGFIGLVSPHITRMVIGGDNRFLLPASGLVGSVLLVGADLLARSIMPPIILPVGVITAVMGGPLLIYLVMKGKKEYW